VQDGASLLSGWSLSGWGGAGGTTRMTKAFAAASKHVPVEAMGKGR